MDIWPTLFLANINNSQHCAPFTAFNSTWDHRVHKQDKKKVQDLPRGYPACLNDLVIRPGSPELPEGCRRHDRLTDGSEVFLLGAEASLLPCRVFPGRLPSLG